MTYTQAVTYIKESHDQVIRLGLERMEGLLWRLGDPQKHLRFIHVAGTNGKGSVCAMTAQILQCAGYRTGLFTSPVISDYREQFQVDGEMISQEAFARLADTVKQACDRMDDPPSEFEKAVALAFLYFVETNCDLVVLEVGLGGVDDATNIIDTPEVAVIVNIDYDHMGFLGNTLEQIAQKKSGIIKEGAVVVTADQQDAVMDVLERRCRKMHATLIRTSVKHVRIIEKTLDGQRFIYDGNYDDGMDSGGHIDHIDHSGGNSDRLPSEIILSLIGDHQCANAAIVLEIIRCLQMKDWHISKDAVREGMKTVRWPGRFEVLSKDPLIIVDGAHNPDGIRALSHNLGEYCAGETFIFITGILKDKDYHEMLMQMLPFAHSFLTVAPDNPRAMSANACAQEIRMCGFDGEIVACSDKQQAVTQALQAARQSGHPICAFGSLYSVGALKEAIQSELEASGK